MLIDFVVQIIIGSLFFIGFLGVGFFVLQFLRIRTENIFLRCGVAFFVSLCVYVALAVTFLYLFSGSALAALHLFSIIYIFISLLFLFYRFLFNSKINLITLSRLIKKHFPAFLVLLIVAIVFFWSVYETAKVDEWLHRPVVKSFVENETFPLVNPHKPLADFSKNYHYGTQVLGAEIAKITGSGVSVSLDIMKVGFVIASFFLFYGLIYHWSRKSWMSALGTAFIFFAGGSFFLVDAYAANHWWYWYQWAPQMRSFNFPLLYVMTGITWVNLPLSIAFLFLIKRQFSKLSKTNLAVISVIWIVMFTGFYLISELFAMFIGGWVFILLLYYAYKKYQNPVVLILALLFSLAALVLMIAKFGGPVAGAFEKYSFSQIVSIRMPWEWGYYTEKGLVRLQDHPLFYLRNFLLEAIIFLVFLWYLFKKKIKISDQPILFFSTIFLFVVPFVFSTVMHNLNLYKLTHLGIILLYLLAFYLFSKIKVNKIVFWGIIILFVFASVPHFFASYNIQWGKSIHAQALKCNENICYENDLERALNKLESMDSGLKVVHAEMEHRQAVVDLSNSYFLSLSEIDSSHFSEMNHYVFAVSTNKKYQEIKNDCKALTSQGKYRICKLEKK